MPESVRDYLIERGAHRLSLLLAVFTAEEIQNAIVAGECQIFEHEFFDERSLSVPQSVGELRSLGWRVWIKAVE